MIITGDLRFAGNSVGQKRFQGNNQIFTRSTNTTIRHLTNLAAYINAYFSSHHKNWSLQ